MKIKHLIPMGLALAFFVMTGCDNMENLPYRGPEESQISFTINGSKTSAISSWKVGSQIGVYTVDNAGVGGVNINAACAVKEGDLTSSDKAAFTGVLMIGTPVGTNSLYAYYPYATFSSATTYDAVPLTLPATQTMSGTSYDGNYSYMYASTDLSVSTSGSSLTFNAGEMAFKPLTGVITVKVKNFDNSALLTSLVSSDDVVENVAITAQGQAPVLTGSFKLNLSNGDMDFGTTGSGRVTINCPSAMTVGALSAKAVVNPFRITGAEESLEIKITIGDVILSKTIAAKDIASGNAFEVAAGNESVIEVAMDDTWEVGGNVPGKIQEFFLVKENVGPHTLCCGWYELEAGSKYSYTLQLFTDKTGSPVYTSPSVTSSTHNMFTDGGPFRFTFTELEPSTTYYMRVKMATNGDNTYSDFLAGTTEAPHTPVAKEVFYGGFDKIYWGSDAVNSSSSVHPASRNASTANPVGWENFAPDAIQPQTNTSTLIALGAFTNADDAYDLKEWRYSTNAIYPCPGYIRLGGGTAAAGIRTPLMGDAVLPASGADCILTFKACPFVITPNLTINGGKGVFKVEIVHEDVANGSNPTDVTNIMSFTENGGLNTHDSSTVIYIGEDYRTGNYQWVERTFTLKNLKPTDKLWFHTYGCEPTYRFMVDDIHVVMK